MKVNFFGAFVGDFIKIQTPNIQGCIYRSLDRLKLYGHTLGMPDSRYLGQQLFELRIISTIHIRIFYTFKNDEAFLLHAFIKKSNKTPKRELEIARRRQKALALI